MEKLYNYTETIEMEEKEISPEFVDLKIIKDDKETEPKKIRRDDQEVDVSFIVLLTDSKELNVEEGSYNLDLLGNPMVTYVARACTKEPSYVKYDGKSDVASLIKPYLGTSEYTMVLYSDTPLMTRENVLNILDFVNTKGLNVCKLTRGYVFKTEYLKRVDEIYVPSVYYFEEEDFLMAVSYKQLHYISEVLKNRIISYHMNNGVYFKCPDNTYIEANVAIGKGTVVYPFVSLLGNTKIGENVLIETNSYLKNAKVFGNAQIEGASLEGAIIQEKAKIKRGAKLFSQTAIKKGVEVGQDCIISNAIIGEYSMIGKNSIINYLKCDEGVSVGDNCRISATQEMPVKIDARATLENNVTLLKGVKVAQEQRVSEGTILKN